MATKGLKMNKKKINKKINKKIPEKDTKLPQSKAQKLQTHKKELEQPPQQPYC